MNYYQILMKLIKMKKLKKMSNFDYNPNYLNNIKILDDKEKEQLNSLNNMTIYDFLNNKNLVEKIGFDFIYSSSQIEGNTYTKAETLSLIEDGITAGGKKYSDAKMILNLKNVYNDILVNRKPINKDTLLDIHYIISEDLVEKQNQGNMRNKPISGIGGTNYIPLNPSERLNEELKYLFKQYNKIENPYEKSIYLHNNLCYLQYFEDCNKRTARTMQFLSLINDDIMPMVIIDNNKEKLSEYRGIIVDYYDTGSHKTYKDFFINCYKEQDKFISKIIENTKVFKPKIKNKIDKNTDVER